MQQVVIGLDSPLQVSIQGALSFQVHKAIDDATSYKPVGFQYAPSFKIYKESKGAYGWDGTIHLLRPDSRLADRYSLPQGLLHRVLKVLEAVEVPYMVIDRMNGDRPVQVEAADDWKLWPATEKHLRSEERSIMKYKLHVGAVPELVQPVGKTLRDYQEGAVRAFLHYKRGILDMATNSGKTCVAASIINSMGAPRTLYIVNTRTLLNQVHKVLTETLEIAPSDIGMIGQGEWKPKRVTVVIINALAIPQERKVGARVVPLSSRDKEKKQKILDFLSSIELLIADENHHVSAKSYMNCLQKCPAKCRLGLSGTPLLRTDHRNIIIEAAIGPIIYAVDQSHLQETGVSAQVEIEMVKVKEPSVLEYSEDWQEVYKEGVIRNPFLNDKAVEIAIKHWKAGHKVMMLVNQVQQGKMISSLLTNHPNGYVEHELLYSKTHQKKIEAKKSAFESGDLSLVIASPIFGEGVDIPNIDILMIVDGGKSAIRVIQRVGRGLRTGGRTDKVLKIYDFAVCVNRRLRKHVHDRLAIYKREGFTVLPWEGIHDSKTTEPQQIRTEAKPALKIKYRGQLLSVGS